MFHRYIYFNTESRVEPQIIQIWQRIDNDGFLRQLMFEVCEGKSQASHQFQRRIQANQDLVTWMDVMSHFQTIEQLDHYQTQIDLIWHHQLKAILPGLDRHIETFQTCV